MDEGQLNLSDVSDKEDAEELDLSPLRISWMEFKIDGKDKQLGITSLPETLKGCEVEDVFCFCTNGELHLYRVQNLLQKYKKAGFKVHHYPFEDGSTPPMDQLITIMRQIHFVLMKNRKTIIHCHGGLGRSCLVAMCKTIALDRPQGYVNINVEELRAKMIQLRGDGALGSVKQYNFVSEFQDALDKYLMTTVFDKETIFNVKQEEEEDRCASR